MKALRTIIVLSTLMLVSSVAYAGIVIPATGIIRGLGINGDCDTLILSYSITSYSGFTDLSMQVSTGETYDMPDSVHTENDIFVEIEPQANNTTIYLSIMSGSAALDTRSVKCNRSGDGRLNAPVVGYAIYPTPEGIVIYSAEGDFILAVPVGIIEMNGIPSGTTSTPESIHRYARQCISFARWAFSGESGARCRRQNPGDYLGRAGKSHQHRKQSIYPATVKNHQQHFHQRVLFLLMDKSRTLARQVHAASPDAPYPGSSANPAFAGCLTATGFPVMLSVDYCANPNIVNSSFRQCYLVNALFDYFAD